MASDGVLILSHCGFSFVEDLATAIRARGLQPFVLSSQPLPEHGSARLHALRTLAASVLSSDAHVLAVEDVEDALVSLRESGYTVRACISVWEGYRALMAHANAQLGVDDLPVWQVDLLRDKLDLRNELHHAGLSRVRALVVTSDVLAALQRDGGAYFIKPARGIASYGAFRLSRETTWSQLDGIAAQARADTVYASALGDDVTFIAEDYLAGTEFSFEVLVSQGRPSVVGLHEKCQLTEASGTVLEDSCTSPPASLSGAQVAAGLAWLATTFDHLGLDWGCFHVEARFDGARWDLIEINPRVGGSLISPSVKALNGEASLLDLWLDLLLEQATPARAEAFAQRLARLAYAADGTPPTQVATFFRVYFAHPGEIDSIEVQPGRRAPVIQQVLLKPGDTVPAASREVFLGQLLWQLSREERDATLASLLTESATAIDVRYRTSSTVLAS
jgi:hypothetical protein